MDSYNTEVLLHFEYAGDKNTENAKKLCILLKENNIDFCAYAISDKYYRPEFYIRRCGRKWNDVMALVNTVQAPVYKKEKETFYITDKIKTDVAGNLQRVCLC